MNPIIATCLCACGVAWLFYLDRDRSVRTSKALWLPVIWIAIVGSRSVSEWLGMGPARADAQRDGSPIDAVIYGILLVAAVGVLIFRSKRTRVLLLTNWPIMLYFFYCLVSISWSYDPDVSFKRWIKAIGDLAMVAIIATERRPLEALARLISRVGFVLLPASVLIIKYFGDFGHEYTPDGTQMNTGVSTNKNMLGVMLLVVSLFTFWRVISLLRAKSAPDRRRHLFAQGILLGFGVLLFRMAHSATAIACFLLGSGIILASILRAFRDRPARVHALCFTIIAVGGVALLFGAQGDVAQALGRQSNLSGRTDIWAAVIPAAPNALIGAGFEGFWISPNVEEFQRRLVGWWHPEGLNEAHNGYIEVYLNLGWIGVVLISTILITGYTRAVKAFRLSGQVGGLFLAYIVVSAAYSITEAGFRMMDLIWIFLLLSVVVSGAVSSRSLDVKAREDLAFRSDKGTRTIEIDDGEPERKSIYATGNELSPFRTVRANGPR